MNDKFDFYFRQTSNSDCTIIVYKIEKIKSKVVFSLCFFILLLIIIKTTHHFFLLLNIYEKEYNFLFLTYNFGFLPLCVFRWLEYVRLFNFFNHINSIKYYLTLLIIDFVGKSDWSFLRKFSFFNYIFFIHKI